MPGPTSSPLARLCTKWRLARRAFAGSSQASVIAAIMRADTPRISAIDPLTPASLDHVVARCLTKDPDERWQTTRDLMIELREIDWPGKRQHRARSWHGGAGTWTAHSRSSAH